MDEKEILSQNLKTLRTNRNLSTAEIAKALSVPSTTYSNWEHAKAVPPLGMLIRLSEFYEISVDSLLGVNEDKVTSEIHRQISGLPPQEKQALLKIIMAMHKN